MNHIKMSFEMEKDFLVYSIYGKIIKKKINLKSVNNVKSYKPYKNEFLG